MTPATISSAASETRPSIRSRPLSPSALVGFTACVHRTELERAREAGLVDKPHFADSTLEALVERGRLHEQAFLEELRSRGKAVTEIRTDELKTSAALEEAARLTGEAMRLGASVIYQATFFDGTWRGSPRRRCFIASRSILNREPRNVEDHLPSCRVLPALADRRM